MKTLIALFVLALLSSIAVIGISVHDGRDKAISDDPQVWESDITRFEQLDRETPPPRDAVLFVGGSSIRLWHTLAADMAPLTTIRRGFGGARVHDLAHYSDRLITRYGAAKVVISIGSDDINVHDPGLLAVPVIRAGLRSLIDTILQSRADTDIYFIALTPTITHRDKWDAVQAANAAAEAVCDGHARCTFIATAGMFLDEQGQARKKLYQFDGAHLSDKGYREWTRRIKPLLLQ